MDGDELMEKLREAMEQAKANAKAKRRKPNNRELSDASDILDEAVRQLRKGAYGGYLLDKYPLRRTSDKCYPEANAVLEEVGSPAMTDGKSVYVSERLLAEMLVQDYPQLKTKPGLAHHDSETMWTNTELDNSKTITMRIMSIEGGIGSYAIGEVEDIILHELTHAINEHSKVSAAMEARGASPETMAKLAVACELQANDGLMGREYSKNLLQRQKGVTNKRLHPETAGCHTLREFMDKLVLNDQEKQQAQSKATAQAMNNTVRMAKATGEYKEQLQQAKEQAEKEKKEKDEGKRVPGYGKPTTQDVDLDTTASEKVAQTLEQAGRAEVKRLLLEALSDQLRYDPKSDSVFFDETIKRVARRTYARPSRKMMVGCGYTILKKGVKYDRVHEPNKANKLTVLAVDASGSMRDQQSYVSSILDDLLKQAETVAREHKLEVHYENLLCTLHRARATKLMAATSAEWAQAMRDYRANGNNNFDCVMDAIRPAVRAHNYDAITILNLSDGFDYLNEYDSWPAELRKAYQEKKLNWVDALLSCNSEWVEEAGRYAKSDDVQIRKQVVLHIGDKKN